MRYGWRRCKVSRRLSRRTRGGPLSGPSAPASGFSSRCVRSGADARFLFTYTERLSLNFHVAAAIEEMCRVARAARIFPLLKGYGGISSYLEPVMYRLRDRGYTATIREVPYEFQRGGNKMLAVNKPTAAVRKQWSGKHLPTLLRNLPSSRRGSVARLRRPGHDATAWRRFGDLTVSYAPDTQGCHVYVVAGWRYA